MVADRSRDSIVRLRLDVASAHILVWFASAGRDGELTPQAHIYFFDRYQRLAEYYWKRGDKTRALEMDEKAAEHARYGGWDRPPHAAAMAMPRPPQWFVTDGVSRHFVNGPDDAA
jgi:hypothetical protein